MEPAAPVLLAGWDEWLQITIFAVIFFGAALRAIVQALLKKNDKGRAPGQAPRPVRQVLEEIRKEAQRAAERAEGRGGGPAGAPPARRRAPDAFDEPALRNERAAPRPAPRPDRRPAAARGARPAAAPPRPAAAPRRPAPGLRPAPPARPTRQPAAAAPGGRPDSPGDDIAHVDELQSRGFKPIEHLAGATLSSAPGRSLGSSGVTAAVAGRRREARRVRVFGMSPRQLIVAQVILGPPRAFGPIRPPRIAPRPPGP